MAPALCRDDVPCSWAPEEFRRLESFSFRSKWTPKASTLQVSSPSSETSTVGSDPLADVLQWLERKPVRDAVPHDTVATCRDGAGNEVDGEDDDGATSRVTDDDDDCRSGSLLGDIGDSGEAALLSHDARAQLPRGSIGQADGKAIARPGRILQPSTPPTTKKGKCADEGCSASSLKEGCFADGKGQSDSTAVEDDEEKEWEQRRRLTGTVCRLVRYYNGMDAGKDVTLRGGSGRHVVVSEVRKDGQAGRSGIRAGDRLVSIDGTKEFQYLSADAISEKLQGSTVLIFVGFIGQLQAEVRLNVNEESLGISNRQEVLHGSVSSPLQLCEERVFNTSVAPLFLSVGFQETTRPLFELRRMEAHRLVRAALYDDGVQALLESNRAYASTFHRRTAGKSTVQAQPTLPSLNVERWSRRPPDSQTPGDSQTPARERIDSGESSHEV